MSDVSKTNGLIEEAREYLTNEAVLVPPSAVHFVSRLADALEAATRVPVQGESNAQKCTSAHCAPRDGQHVTSCPNRQGEPNDDRTPEFEAIEQELFKHQPLLSMQDGSIRGCKCMDRVFVTKTEDWGTHLADVFMRLPRAVVPDAATAERVKKIILESLVFTNESSDLWAQLLTENILAALDGAPEPEWEGR